MNRSLSAPALAGALILLCALCASAAEKTLVVLPLDITKTEGKMSPSMRASVEEMLRDEAANALADNEWTVMTGETTLRILSDSGIDASKCGEGSCHLSTAKEMNVDKFISGAVQYAEGTFTASVRLMDTKTGRILASTRLESETVKGLRKEFAAKAQAFFEKAGLVAGGGSSPAPAGPAQGTAAPAQTGPVRAAQGTIKVVSTPLGAKVSIDGDAVGPTPVTAKRDAGTYVVTVELSGFAPASRQVEVTSGKVSLVSETLMQAAGYLEVNLTPEAAARAATVTVDGQPAGVGKQGPYKVGRHAVRVEAAGYKAAEQSVGVDNGGTAQVSLALEALPGKLLVSVNVAAVCTAGGAQVQATADGVVKLEVAAGAVEVKCSAEGYEEQSAEVTVGPGKAQPVKLTLKRQAMAAAGGGGQGGVEPKSGLRFVSIPGGSYQFQGKQAVSIKAFRFGETATTVEAYKRCVNAGACTAPKTDSLCNWNTERTNHPINCVDWNQATAFCRWIGGRLPTEEEREYVVSGGEGRTYPWGNEEPGSRACWDGEGSDLGKGNRKTTCPVGSYRAGDSKWGLHDLAGNVWEWTSTDYDSSNKVVRGGSWYGGDPALLRASYRYGPVPSGQNDVIGFRCGL